ncbi:hypothetical protein QSH57_004889 [Fusarium oxysporum f. sp. vasinfectum]|nr:hypothetical protein QSH57_004889 [Fusarium oxysporum f. sp. vasinfectum]
MVNQVAPPDPRCPRSQPAFLRDSLPKPPLNGRLRERSQSPGLSSLCYHQPSTSRQRDLLFLAACRPQFQMTLASAVATGERRRSHEYARPPRFPSGPPIRKGLRHLASPPLPPPAGAVASDMVETAMDDDLPSGNNQASEASSPALASHKGQSRDRSTEDISSILVHKVNKRFRSASGSRKERV